MIDEIHAGIKNAIERGSSLEEAVQSFISAGYNPVEVKEAANSIGSGAGAIINFQQAQSQNSEGDQKKVILPDLAPNSKKKKASILLIVLLLLLTVALVTLIFFSKYILALLK